MRVVHLVESLGGGVLSSVLTMVDSTPEIEHHLLIWPWREHVGTSDGLQSFGGVSTLDRRPDRAAHGLRRAIDAMQPDVLHAHSSYAGMLARLPGLDVDVHYSPHCFAFERSDIGTATRAGIRRLERSLVRRTAFLVACSPHEARIARDLGHRRVVTVPNRALDPPEPQTRFSSPQRIVTVGRVGAQKDWRHLLAAKQAYDGLSPAPVEWEWLGGGDTDAEAELRDGGVAVSGWLPRTEVIRRLAAAQVYVHTAAWEGAPVSVVEAAAAGLPIVARGIPTLASLNVPGLAASPEEIAHRLLALRDPGHWRSQRQRSLAYAADQSRDAQRRRLGAAYQFTPAASPGRLTARATQLELIGES